MKGTSPKGWQQLLEEVAATDGWLVDKTNAGHVKITPPGGRPIFFGSTLSEYRGLANNRAKLKRAGWPPKVPLTLPAQIVPPRAPTNAPTERETPMSERKTSEAPAGLLRPGDIARGIRRHSFIGPPEIVLKAHRVGPDTEVTFMVAGEWGRHTTTIASTRRVEITR